MRSRASAGAAGGCCGPALRAAARARSRWSALGGVPRPPLAGVLPLPRRQGRGHRGRRAARRSTLARPGDAATWVIIAAFFRYSSLASLVAAVFAPFYQLLTGAPSRSPLAHRRDVRCCWSGATSANIASPVAGTESRLGEQGRRRPAARARSAKRRRTSARVEGPKAPSTSAANWTRRVLSAASRRAPSRRARRASSRARPCARARCRPRRSSAPASGRPGRARRARATAAARAMIASITGCLQSRQPMPAVVQPLHDPVLGRRRRSRPGGTATPGTSRGCPGRCAARAPGRSACARIFCVDLGRLLAHRDRVAVALAHLRAVEAGQLQHLGVQRLRLGAGSSCRCRAS